MRKSDYVILCRLLADALLKREENEKQNENEPK